MNLKYYKLARTDDRYDDQEMIEVDPANGEYLRKDEVQPIIAAYEKMIKKLIEFKDVVRQSSELRIKNTDDFNFWMNKCPEIELPLRINTHPADSPIHFLISCRLSGEDPLEKDLFRCMPLLYNEEFDYEDYKNIGYTDGSADVTASLLKIAEMPKESNEASDATYSTD
jgi:hypothetical protein